MRSFILFAIATGLACPVLMFFAIRRKRMGLVYLSLLALTVAVVCGGIIAVRIGVRLYEEQRGSDQLHFQFQQALNRPTGDSLTSPAAVFFKNIYQRRSDEYFPLGSKIGFRESYSGEPAHLDWTLSFYEVDTLERGEDRYVRTYTDTVLERILPNITWLLGVESCHYELSVNGLDFHGYVCGKDGDFVQDTTGYTTGFIRALGEVEVRSEQDKRSLANALLTFLNTGIRRNLSPCLKKVSYSHTGDPLRVTHTYNGNCAYTAWHVISQEEQRLPDQTIELTLVFDHDRVVAIAR